MGGIPLQIEDGESGYLVGPRDITATADRIARLLDDEALRRQLGKRGRETIQERFLLPRLVVDYLRLLSDTTGSSVRP